MSKIILFLLLLLPCSVFAGEKLVFGVDVIRHGDRMPLRDLSKAAAQWPLPLGQLSPRGMRQEFELGAAMRADYVDRYGLLPSSYAAGTVYVRSSDIDRTLMSAQCVLAGLYPHGTGPTADGQAALPDLAQPVPVHTVSSAEETLLYPDGPLYHFAELQPKYVYNTPQWKSREEALRPNFSRWGEATGEKITDLLQVKSLADVLYIRRLYNVAPPAGLTAKDVDEIVDAGQWAFAASFGPAEIGRATGLPLLKEIVGRMEGAAGGKDGVKYVLYSAHDSTILSELSALGAPAAEPPHYSSRLSFLLFYEGERKFVVKTVYNGATVAVKGCGPEFCTLEQFLALGRTEIN